MHRNVTAFFWRFLFNSFTCWNRKIVVTVSHRFFSAILNICASPFLLRKKEVTRRTCAHERSNGATRVAVMGPRAAARAQSGSHVLSMYAELVRSDANSVEVGTRQGKAGDAFGNTNRKGTKNAGSGGGPRRIVGPIWYLVLGSALAGGAFPGLLNFCPNNLCITGYRVITNINHEPFLCLQSCRVTCNNVTDYLIAR
ncbi:hypothetical protein SEVIR_1G303750v4 [Setaria viridis]